MDVRNKNIFISPLDWGLGHTTRCISIIKALQELGANLYLGVNQVQKKILDKEVSRITYLHFDGYNIEYPNSNKMALKMALQIPKVLLAIKNENRNLSKIVKEHNIDLVISDNRFGLYNISTPSIYITHQINIQAPLGIDKLLFKLHKKYIDNFVQCWIPDYENNDSALAGKLSHGKTETNYHYLSPISRFETPCLTTTNEYAYLAIISGPEPQRTTFEKIIINLFEHQNKKCAILGGQPLLNKNSSNKNIDYYSHLDSSNFYELINITERVISRPGYSTIMDLGVLQKPVFFIPTPGQTEQEYLARLYKEKYNIGYVKQNKLTRLDPNQFNLIPFTRKTNLKSKILELVEKIE